MDKTIPPFDLDPWRVRQAAMLYHYASVDYLKGLHQLVTQLLNGLIEQILDLTREQGRDRVLVDARWGTRNTSANWSDNAWPVLKEMQQALSKDISLRSFGVYRKSFVLEALRGADQYSMQWTSPDEEERYEQLTRILTQYASRIDQTLENYSGLNQWDDHGFAYEFGSFASECNRIPQFVVRADLAADTGDAAPRTGVYVSADDAHATLQFAWAAPPACRLRQARTFNEIGFEALQAVGRQGLWFDHDRMFKFASRFSPLFRDVIYNGNEALRSLRRALWRGMHSPTGRVAGTLLKSSTKQLSRQSRFGNNQSTT
jgi:hypothetical protein